MAKADLFTPVSACRICGSQGLFPVVDLGRQPLANSLLAPGGPPAPTYPLAVVGCPGCTVVQLSGTVDPRAMFDNYLYLSSYSTSMVEAMRRLAGRRQLDQWVEVWENLTHLFAEADDINLDRKQVVLNVFFTLEAAAR